MTKKILAFLFISALALGVTAQTTVAAADALPAGKEAAKVDRVVTEDALTLKEPEFNFGKIPQGKPVTHVFEVMNSGKDSLHIVNVQASCGCTTPAWDKEKVPAPGEKIDITVGYNAASEGPFSKQITITYNGTQSKQLVIKGEVWKTPATSAPENKELKNLKD